MTRLTKRLIAAVLLITLFASACGGAAPSPDPADSVAGSDIAELGDSTDPGGTDPGPSQQESAAVTPSAAEPDSAPLPAVPSEPNPASIDITLEEGSAARGTIGSEGGSLEAVDQRGTRYTLTVQEGALLSPVEITMSPIAVAEGQAIGDTFLAGVALEPEGLHFLKMAVIEITGDVVAEGAVGFAAGGGGQDFHLTHSVQAGRSVMISTTHFSEFGVSDEGLEGQIEEFISDNEEALVETALALGADQLILNALNNWAQVVQDSGEIDTYEEWASWTASFSSLLQWTFYAIEVSGWNMDTPGVAGLLDELQAILDQWFEQTTAVVEALAEKCQDGELVEFIKIQQIIEVGESLVTLLSLERDEELQSWKDLADTCLNFTLTWQANVLTTGENFESDIAIGTEITSQGSKIAPPVNASVPLEVEYIAGFWEQRCEGIPGFVSLEGEVDWDTPNFGSSFEASLEKITVYVGIILNVFIDCSPAGFPIPADAQEPFHGGALVELNKDRLEDGRWKFDLEYNPGGGLVAQFEEGLDEPIKLPFPTGEYEFYQLVSLYVNAPGD